MNGIAFKHIDLRLCLGHILSCSLRNQRKLPVLFFGKPMRYMCTRWFIVFLVLQAQCISLSGPIADAAFQNNTVSFLRSDESGWMLEAGNIPLKQLLDSINNRFGITVSGLANRETETVNIQVRGKSMEAVLKGFLRHLGEDNYAFEYAEKKLEHISIFPAADTKAAEPDQGVAAAKEPPEAQVRMVEIVDVVEGSQAQEMGLKKGDLIVEYDGIKLDQPSSLVAETKKKSPDETVEMLIWRDGSPVHFFVNGGYIGVRIRSKHVPKNLMSHE